ncbi:MAG: sugar phosphate isomerase/epimerase [Ruminococcus sp.]|nr:sugar phosphate isomerase/epimerase [Candidatus Copronaster equi]
MEKFRIGFGAPLDKMLYCNSIGADYFEVDLRQINALSDDELEELLKLIREKNITIEAGKNFIPGIYKLTVDEPDFDAIDDFLDKTLNRASKLGIKVVVMGSAAARDYPEGVTYEQAFDRLVFFFKNHMVPACSKYGIVCAIENLSYGESNILNTIEESYNIVKAVDSEWIKILVDFYHFGHNKDSFDSIRKAKDYIVHTHFASVVNNREYPVPEADTADCKAWIDLLREIGYKGRLSFEAHEGEGQQFSDAAKISLDMFRAL